MIRFLHLPADLRRRLTAVLAAALVLALDLLAVSPAAHAWLHGHDPAAPACSCGHHAEAAAPAPADDREDGCIVSIFAQGKLDGSTVPHWCARPVAHVSASACFPPAVAPAAVAHLLPPGCGPPLV